MNDAPIQAPYARHVFICTGKYCDPEGKAQAIYRRLAFKLGELGQYDNPARVKRGVTPCLGVCYNGPLLVVYPDGIWYHHVDEALLDRIVEEHLLRNRPVEEHIFHWLDENPLAPNRGQDLGCHEVNADSGDAVGWGASDQLTVMTT